MVNPLTVSVPQARAPVHHQGAPGQAPTPVDEGKGYTGPLLFLRWHQAILDEVKAGRLSTAAGHLAGVLAAHFRTKTEECAVGERTLRKLTGRRTVKRDRDELVAGGWLEAVVGVYHSPTSYRLALPDHLAATVVAQGSHKRARIRHTPVREYDTPTNAQRARIRHETNGATNGANAAGASRTGCGNLNEVEAGRRLRKAVGRRFADLAIEEVNARLTHGEPVLSQWGLARQLAECYAGRCRDRSHSDLHGLEAIAYHAARRRDWEQEARGADARRRGATFTLPEDDPVEEVRRRQLEALARFDTSTPSTGASAEATVEGLTAGGDTR